MKLDGLNPFGSVEEAYLMQAFSCLLGREKATYLSGPITTGKRYVDWLVASSEQSVPELGAVALRLKIQQANEEDLLIAADRLRVRDRSYVIEPASLRIPSWTQQAYHLFWRSVLERFVDRMLMMEGWEYSVGCSAEFRCASEFGIPVYDLQGRILSPNAGFEKIKAAAEYVVSNCYERPEASLLARRLMSISGSESIHD